MLTDPADKSNMNHLFICGCPRSGTTALWELIAPHKRVAIGVERYALRCFGPFTLSPELFESERFFSVQPGDTFYDDLERFSKRATSYYGELRSRFASTDLRGDKVPMLYARLPELYSAIPNTKVLFIFRNIFEVASSYNGRAEDRQDAAWSREQNYVEAVSDWNRSLRAAIAALDQQRALFCVEYESLFGPGYDLSRLFDFLELPLTDEVRNNYKSLLIRSAVLEDSREDRLSSEQKRYILRHAAIGPYRALSARCSG